MKKIIFSCLMAFIFSTGFAQQKSATLKIMGSCQSSYIPNGYAIQIKFLVDKNKCDPLTGFVSMEEKKHHFEETLNSKGMKFLNFEKSLTKSNIVRNIQTEIFNYTGDSLQILEIIQIAKHQEIHVQSVKQSYKRKSLADQDADAICALEEAVRKANHVSKSLGFKNCILRSVDDDSSFIGSDFDEASLENLKAMLESMASNGDNYGGSVYSIIANFEIF